MYGGTEFPLASLTPPPEQKLDRVLREKQGLDKQRQDRLISSVSQTLTTAVNQKLDRVVKNEVKAQVVPSEWSSLWLLSGSAMCRHSLCVSVCVCVCVCDPCLLLYDFFVY